MYLKTSASNRAVRIASFILLACAVAMSVFQYLYGRSFWTDEAAVVINVLDRDFVGLMSPLMFYQMAPILYLWITKAITTIFPANEYSFRFLSMLGYMVSLWLLWKLLTRYVKDSLAIFIGLAFFVFNNKLLYYSSELKQYMTDVTVTLALLYLVTDPKSSNQRKIQLLAIIGAIAIYLSNVVVTVLPMVFLFIFLAEDKPWRWSFLKGLVLMGFVWLSAFLVNYLLFVHNHPSRPQQQIFFAEAFPPANLLSKQAIAFFEYKIQVLKRDFGFGKNNIHPTVSFIESIHYGVFLLLIAGYLWKCVRSTDRRMLLLLIPILLHSMLAYFKAYPLAIRIMLYQYPLIVIMLAMGAEQWLGKLPKPRRVIEFVTMALTLVLSVAFIRVQLPNEVEESRGVLSYMQSHSDKQEDVYSYNPGNLNIDAYVRNGFYKPAGKVVLGKTIKDSVAHVPSEIMSAGSTHSWIFFAHFDPGIEYFVMDSLSAKGHRVIDSVRAKGVVAYRTQLDK
jgi:hypothetical protein